MLTVPNAACLRHAGQPFLSCRAGPHRLLLPLRWLLPQRVLRAYPLLCAVQEC